MELAEQFIKGSHLTVKGRGLGRRDGWIQSWGRAEPDVISHLCQEDNFNDVSDLWGELGLSPRS